MITIFLEKCKEGSMKRAKPPKKNKEPTQKLSTHFIMSVVMPCVALACKDVFKADQKQLDEMAKAADRYMGYIADGKATLQDLHKLMEVIDDGYKKSR
jgi:hypothetical protein